MLGYAGRRRHCRLAPTTSASTGSVYGASSLWRALGGGVLLPGLDVTSRVVQVLTSISITAVCLALEAHCNILMFLHFSSNANLAGQMISTATITKQHTILTSYPRG